MRKNIRRSLMVAAAASGIWALSTAGASAAELPAPSGAGSAVSGTVEKAHEAQKAGADGESTVAGTVRGATGAVEETTGVVEDVTEDVRQKLPTKGIPENGLPTNTLPTGDLPTGADDVTGKLRGTDATDATGAVGGAKGAADQVLDGTGHASKAVKEAQKDVRSSSDALPAAPAVPALPGTGDLSRHLPPHTLPAYAVPAVPDAPAVPAAGLPAAPLRPEQLTAVLRSRPTEETVSKVRNTVATVHPVIDNVSGAVPPARPVQLHARATAYQFATDAAKTVDCALSTTAPFVESTYYRAETLSHDVPGGAVGFAHGVVSDSAVYAHELVGTGVHGNVHRLVDHTVTNVGSLVTAPTKRDLTDPANIPGLPVAPQVPAGL